MLVFWQFTIPIFKHLVFHKKQGNGLHTNGWFTNYQCVSSYKIVGFSYKNRIKPYTPVSILIIKGIIVADDKCGSFLHKILKYNKNIHQNTQIYVRNEHAHFKQHSTILTVAVLMYEYMCGGYLLE